MKINVICTVPEYLTMKIENEITERTNSVKFLGMIIDSKLEWKEHIVWLPGYHSLG